MTATSKAKSAEEKVFGLLGTILRIADRLSSRLSSRLLYWLWCHALRHPPSPKEQLFKAEAKATGFSVNGVNYKFHSLGDGPVVLTVHGWDGRGTQMMSFFKPLVDAGFKVVTFDAHGHGESPGQQTNGVIISDMIVEISNRVGGCYAMIAHSMGGSFALVALEKISVEKVVLIAPPQNLEAAYQKVKMRLDIPDRPGRLFKERFERNFPNAWNRFSIDQMVTKLAHVKGLIIQDRDDDFVYPDESKAIHERWKGSELLFTEGLGHRKILRDDVVVQRTVDFLTGSVHGRGQETSRS